jgi:hypothetical protein
MSDIKQIVKEEVDKLVASLEGQIQDSATRAAIVRMTNDMAMLPVRMSQGEDVTVLFASLQAEAAMRGVSASLKAQTLVQQAWINILTRVISIALAAL